MRCPIRPTSVILALHKHLLAATSPARKTILQRQIDSTDSEIDRLVYGLYGLTPEEIALIESQSNPRS